MADDEPAVAKLNVCMDAAATTRLTDAGGKATSTLSIDKDATNGADGTANDFDDTASVISFDNLPIRAP
jgi:hypothetical protein